nr:hypothetical protein BaRGS_026415 [Batillaria attramentaria]
MNDLNWKPGDPLDINTGVITKAEIRKALSSLKNGKAAGTDNIPAEALKEGGNDIIDQPVTPPAQRDLDDRGDADRVEEGPAGETPQARQPLSVRQMEGHHPLVHPQQVCTRVILDRMKDVLDKTLRGEQARFRKERSCTDQIATLRVIVEQSIEWQSPLYVCFIDFGKVFDSVDRQAIWNILLHYGVPPKFVDIIRRLYEGFITRLYDDLALVSITIGFFSV